MCEHVGITLDSPDSLCLGVQFTFTVLLLDQIHITSQMAFAISEVCLTSLETP